MEELPHSSSIQNRMALYPCSPELHWSTACGRPGVRRVPFGGVMLCRGGTSYIMEEKTAGHWLMHR